LFDDGTFIRASINNTITEKLMQAVGNVSAVRNAAVSYFKSIHVWFPILSEISFYERLSSIFDKPCAEYSLLSLSMVLITTMPPVKDTLDSFTSLYILVKSSIAIAEAGNINSLEIVQARLLVSLFEFGHGMPAAFISIAATVRAAVAIGINQTVKKPCTDVSSTCSKLEEGLRVWWGIVMLDRLVLPLISSFTQLIQRI
jgi:Fungal specific transcription factor domain